METPIDKNKENIDEQSSLTPTRDSDMDIIGGARQTDQLDQLQANAQKHESGNQSTQVTPLAVNDGTEMNEFANSNQPKVEHPHSEE